METSFTKLITVGNTPDEVYKAITEQIHAWWTSDFEGASAKLGDEFTVRFGPTFKTMRIEDASPGKLVVWRCIDQHLQMPDGIEQLKNKKEWVGNRLLWRIEEKENETVLHFVHEGLNPEVECWGVCEQGWDQTFISLINLLQTGKGNPFVMLDEHHLEKAKSYHNS